jgi:hypothetical protein
MKGTIIATLSMLTALASAPLAAEQPMKLDIPFDFVVSDRVLPSGQYTVSGGTAPGTVLIQNTVSHAAAFAITNAASKPMSARYANPGVTFQRYGDRYFLSKVWPYGSDQGHELPKCRLERELAAKLNTGKPAEVALSASR